MIQNNHPAIIGEVHQWDQLQRPNLVIHCILQIQQIPPHGYLVFSLVPERILVVIMPYIAKTFKCVINEMTNWTNCQLVNMLHPGNWISPRMIQIQALMSRRTDAIPTLFHMIPSYPECNHQATANSHTVYGFLGFLNSPIDTRLKAVWAAILQSIWEMDSNFKSHQCQDSIHSMTGIIRWYSNVQVHLKVQRLLLRWKSMVQRYCIQWETVQCMASIPKTEKLRRMQCIWWPRLPDLWYWGCAGNQSLKMENHSFQYRRRMHTSFIFSGLRKSK